MKNRIKRKMVIIICMCLTVVYSLQHFTVSIKAMEKKTTTSKKTTKTTTKAVLTSAQAKKLGISNSFLNQITTCIKLVNNERKKKGLPSVTTNFKLIKSATTRSKEISKKFAHSRPNGKSCFSILKDNKIPYRASGENIAAGQKNAKQVMRDWMNSSGHRANIMNKKYRKVGIGIYKGGRYGINWTQIFTN